MRAFKLEILTPSGQSFSGDVTGIYLRTTDGAVGILAGHTDFLAGVTECTVKLIDADEKEQYAYCGGGFFRVSEGEATLIADEFVFAKDIDEESLLAEIEEIHAQQAEAVDAVKSIFLTSRLGRLQAKQKTLAAYKENQ